MKCISCGNLIPDGSTVCPYCNKEITPSVPATTINNNEGNSVIPSTPTQPILPQDQNLMTANNSEQGMTPVAQVTPTAAVVNEPQVPAATPVVNQTPVENVLQTSQPQVPVQPVQQVQAPVENVQQPQVAPTNVAPSLVVNEVSTPQVSAPQVESTSMPEMKPITPGGEIIDGTKVGSTVAPNTTQTEKKSKKGLIIGLVIALVVLLIGGIGVFVYFYEFKSADKRLEAVVTNLMSFTSSIKNDSVEKSSGNYNVDLKVSSGDTTMSGALKGTYAIDLENKIMDYTFDLESLNMGQELLTQPINLEVYLNDAKIYVLLENFYENYIYDEFPEYDEMLSSIQQNDINYAAIMNAITKATNAGVSAMNTTQSIEDVTINGTKKKTNVVKIVMTARNQKSFAAAFIRSLSNNSMFIAEMAKISGVSEEELKENLNTSLDDVEFEDNKSSIEVYTTLMGTDLDGIKITIVDEMTYTAEVYPVTNGYGISVKEGTSTVFEGEFVSTQKKTSTTRETTTGYNMTLFVEDVAYRIELNMSVIDDVNPKVEKVNVKNSINRMYLTDMDKATIKQKASEMGEIGLYLPTILDLYLGTSSSSIDGGLTEMDADPTKCTMVANCTAATIDGYSICQNQQTFENVICNNAWLGY